MHQVGEFLAAGERRNRSQRIGDALMARMAQAEGKAWAKYMKKLEGK